MGKSFGSCSVWGWQANSQGEGFARKIRVGGDYAVSILFNPLFKPLNSSVALI